jgi:hypothetical protein
MNMSNKNKLMVALSVVFCGVCIGSGVWILPKIFDEHYVYTKEVNAANTLAQKEISSPVIPPTPSYVVTPSVVKGIYFTSWTTGTPSLRNKLVSLVDETELNSVVIDIKDYSGKIVFPIKSSVLARYGSGEVRVKDMRDFLESLHQKNIYVIGRVAVFQDEYFVKYRPDLAVENKAGTEVWKDRKGISWIDPSSREYWDYILLIAKEARSVGFDEINFDYIRFPSDGDMKDISYPWSSTTPKTLVLKSFFQYLHTNLVDSGLKISADLFGMVTTSTNDLGIGQLLENALPYFDFISPMVYPSHYPPTFQGFKEPEAHPYDVVHYAMNEGVIRAENLASTTGAVPEEYKNKLRPWLQDFGLRVHYGPEEVRAQIQATNDVGLSSWLLWSASNKYTRSALNSE